MPLMLPAQDLLEPVDNASGVGQPPRFAEAPEQVLAGSVQLPAALQRGFPKPAVRRGLGVPDHDRPSTAGARSARVRTKLP